VALALRELGARPAVVSRGYGRSTRGVAIVADGDGPRLAPREAGDEPALLADRLPGVPVVVGENRLEAGRTAIERCGANAIVLDDGFQHRTLWKDLELVVVNGRSPWGNQRLFPRGMLREPLSALGRADLVVVTNPTTDADVAAATEVVRRHKPEAPVLTARYEVMGVREMQSGADVSPSHLRGRRLLAFAGLASPRGFADTLAVAGVDVAGLVEYPDHHWFTQADLVEVVRQSRAEDADGLITTEKDAVRLRGLDLPSIRLCVVQVRLQIETGRERLLQALERVLARAAR
jgi:tetraacyldisaccharide 4'-kinase